VIFDTTQLALHEAIAGTTARQQALAGNLANANTPGYRRVDVDFHSKLAAALGQGAGAGGALESMTFAATQDGSVGATRADGGSLDVDAESAKIAANALEQQALVQVAHARTAIMKSAMGVS
jgi:flagellar basal-body rod protein FlgB